MLPYGLSANAYQTLYIIEHQLGSSHVMRVLEDSGLAVRRCCLTAASAIVFE